MSTRDRWALALVSAGFALSLVLALTHAVPFPTRAFLYDFRASFCAGSALDQGADPYRTEPLRTCEHSVQAFRPDLVNLTAPAPLPGFELAPFAALARLPYDVAAGLWLAASAMAFAIIGLGLIRLSGLPPRVVWPAIVLSGCFSIFLGQLVIVAVAALVLAALALEKRAYATAGFAACVAGIEPHVALPALLTLMLFVPRSRLVIGICIGVGAGISLLAIGLHGNIEYFHSVLPGQTASEIANEEQYSVAFALHRLAAADAAALAWANVAFAIAVIVGIATARILVNRGGPASLYILLPPAFVVPAGPYAHIHHMFFVLPAAVVLLGRVLPQSRAIGPALILLAIPWGAFPELLPLLPLVAAVGCVLTREVMKTDWTLAALGGVAAGASIVLLALQLVPRPEMSQILAPFTAPQAMPEVAWKAYIDAAYHSNVEVFAIAKIPTLLALFMIMTATWRACLSDAETDSARAAQLRASVI